MEKTKTLKDCDLQLFELIAKEKRRQEEKINLIASEVR
jgi:glycine/serine hydroxymethyltransferase